MDSSVRGYDMPGTLLSHVAAGVPEGTEERGNQLRKGVCVVQAGRLR